MTPFRHGASPEAMSIMLKQAPRTSPSTRARSSQIQRLVPSWHLAHTPLLQHVDIAERLAGQLGMEPPTQISAALCKNTLQKRQLTTRASQETGLISQSSLRQNTPLPIRAQRDCAMMAPWGCKVYRPSGRDPRQTAKPMQTESRPNSVDAYSLRFFFPLERGASPKSDI